LVVAMIGCALAIAACGSSHKATRVAGRSQFLQFSECMRSHGVTNFPDPSARGGIELNANSGINPFSPSFKAAQSACRKLLPGGGPPQHASEQDKQRMLQVSECMRAHGVTGFPDPTTQQPSNPQDYGILEDRGGVIVAVPKTINPQSPAFQRASKACNFS
jgi:hypothetical protein